MDLSDLCTTVANATVVVPEGARTQWEVANPPAAGTSVRAPAGVVAYEPADMTVTVGARTTFAELDAVLDAEGQHCPLDPRDGEATVGGILATGLSGTRRLGHGPLRDHVLEVRFVTADGRVVKGGGPTVKNVTGYDLPRLFVGSFGTLGVLAQLTLRCRPRPRVTRWLRASEPPRGFYRPISMLWLREGVFVRCEGNEADIDAQARDADCEPADAPALPEGPHRGRISVAPSAMADVVADLGGARWCAELGVGTIHVATDDVGALVHARDVAEANGGWLLREAGGDGIDGFGRALPNAELMLRIKRAFDPSGKLAPGRLPL
jgi:glycolate oxidase FAD binding subunit